MLSRCRKSFLMKRPTKAQRERWSRIAELGCMVCGAWQVQIHHCFTGGGGRKDHDKVAPLCHEHHIGREGIDGRVMSKKAWQAKYMTEDEMIERVKHLLGEVDAK